MNSNKRKLKVWIFTSMCAWNNRSTLTFTDYVTKPVKTFFLILIVTSIYTLFCAKKEMNGKRCTEGTLYTS